jgi:thioester reductase-like protein
MLQTTAPTTTGSPAGEQPVKHRAAVLLTGATGFLGRYLMRDLLAAGHRLAVLVRDAAGRPARERLDELLNFGEETLGSALPRPVVLAGDLARPGLGLSEADRRWLAGHCDAVVHAAASVSYRPTAAAEPWETNVNGTQRLLELCRQAGVRALHHVSTAFVCGDRRGPVREDELECCGGTHNAYEQSKVAAERLVRQARHAQVTVYRPSVVVGDSRTGYTSTYHHFYNFLELAVRLSSPGGRRRRLPLRLPLTGEERPNLVPVDWVSAALVRLLRRPRWHGRTFHLVARQPARLQEILAILEDLLQLEGIRWAGPGGLPDPTPLEERVLEQLRDYWNYLRNDLAFDCRNTCRALPDLPPPRFDRPLVERLLQFALADQWGRGRAPEDAAPSGECADFLERFLPGQARESAVIRAVSLDLTFALDIRGPGGGQWSYRWERGELAEVRRGLAGGAAVTFHTDAATFVELIRGGQAPQNSFFEDRIEITGDVETGLKLAGLFAQLLAESPYQPPLPCGRGPLTPLPGRCPSGR